MKSPLVTIVIPTYNRANLILEALESALNQTSLTCEVIVIDDGSTDDTENILKPHMKSFRYFRKENGGCASARNLGMRKARGEFLLFLDSDDMLCPEAVSSLLSPLRQRPDAGFAYSNSYVEKNGSRERFIPFGVNLSWREFRISFFSDTSIYFPSCLFRRAAVVAIGGFNEKMRHTEDSDFMIRMALKSPPVYVPVETNIVRIHSGSKSQDRVRLVRALITSSKEILREHPDFEKELGAEKERHFYKLRWWLVELLLHKRRYEEAAEELRTFPVMNGGLFIAFKIRFYRLVLAIGKIPSTIFFEFFLRY